MNTLSPDIFAQCLKAVESGQATVERCVAQYPEYAAELEGLLRTALALAPGPAVEPDAHFRSRGRSALLTAIALEHGVDERSAWRRFADSLIGKREASPVGRPRQAEMPIPVFFALAILVGGGSAAVSLAAEESLPGEPLYSLKSATEIVRLTLDPSAEGKAELQLVYATRRLDEMERMAGLGRTSRFQATAQRYADHLRQAEAFIADKPTSKVSNDLAMLRERISRRDLMLAELRSDVPASAQLALEEAISITQGIDAPPAPVVALAPSPAPSVAPAPAALEPIAPTPTPMAIAEAVQSLEELETTVTSLPSEPSPALATQHEALVVQVASAKEAVADGQPEAAANNLTVFASEIVLMQQSGNITTETFQALYKSYAKAASKVGATMAADGRANRTVPQPAPAPTAEPTDAGPPATTQTSPSARPTAVLPTPTPGSGDRGAHGGAD